MRRRRRLVLATSVLLLAGQSALAQRPPKVWRVAILEPGDRGSSESNWTVFLARMRELGYVEGRNLSVDRRWADGVADHLPRLAQELMAGSPDVAVVVTTPATRALMRASATIPIVMAGVGDPVGVGLVASLARPGGNVTGASLQLAGVVVKRIDLLREIVPGAKRFGLLGSANEAGLNAVLAQAQAQVQPHGLVLRAIDAGDAAGIARAFDRLGSEPVDALLVSAPLRQHLPLVIERAARFRIPASYVHNEAIDLGGLIVYAPVREAAYRQAADYVDRIFRGAKPADMPVTQPTEYWLGVNLATARTLGLTVPQSVLIRADRVLP